MQLTRGGRNLFAGFSVSYLGVSRSTQYAGVVRIPACKAFPGQDVCSPPRLDVKGYEAAECYRVFLLNV